MTKTIRRIANGLGAAAGALSFVLLLDNAIRVSWVDSIGRILEYYKATISFVCSPLEPLIAGIIYVTSRILQIHISLSAHWSDVFVLLLLYFGARARAYWDSGIKGRAGFRCVWGLFVSFFTAVLAGALPLANVVSSISVAAITLLGIGVFEIGDCTWSATFSRKQGLTWKGDFERYAAFSFPPIVIGTIVLLVGATLSIFYFSSLPPSSGLFLLVIIAFILALYWMIRGWQFAGDVILRLPGESRFQKFKRSSNTRIAVLMLSSILGATLFILLNAGLSYAGL